MPDYMTTVTAQETIKGVAKSLVIELCRALGLPDNESLECDIDKTLFFQSKGDSGYALEWSEGDGELYIFAEDYATTSAVPQEFWDVLARLLTQMKMDYLTFSYASHCSKAAPGSFGGGEFRLYRDGQVVYAVTTHPEHKLQA